MTDTKHSADLPPLPAPTFHDSKGYTADQMHAYARAAIAAAAPVGEPVGYADPMSFVNFEDARANGKSSEEKCREWMWATPDTFLVPLYAAPVPAAAPEIDCDRPLDEIAIDCGADGMVSVMTSPNGPRTAVKFKLNDGSLQRFVKACHDQIIKNASPKAALTPEQIEQIAVDHKLPVRLASATDSHWAYTDKVMAFAKAIEAASGPNAALATALEQLIEHCDNVGACGMAIEDARAALAAAGIGDRP